MRINLALISPNQNAYSETFIQNHKKGFDANVKFYYGDALPTYLEGQGRLWISPIERISDYLKGVLRGQPAISPQYKALIKSFRKEKIDIVYAEYGITGVAILEICKKLNLPLIVNFHGYDLSEYSVLEAYKEAYQSLFEYASNIIAVSKVMVDKLIDLGCNPNKIVYTPCAPENSFFDIKPEYTENSFLFVGRFVDKKAPYYTILAFKKVLEKYPNAKLYMAGEGPLLNTCINLSNYLKINQQILFLGKCTHKELMSYYTKVKGYVQHSITSSNGDMEGTPVAILEASAAALPVVSTLHAGIPDVIINKETGLLVHEHDVDGMAQNMIHLLEDEQIVKAMGNNGRRNVQENFNMKIHLQKLNSLIYKIKEEI